MRLLSSYQHFGGYLAWVAAGLPVTSNHTLIREPRLLNNLGVGAAPGAQNHEDNQRHEDNNHTAIRRRRRVCPEGEPTNKQAGVDELPSRFLLFGRLFTVPDHLGSSRALLHCYRPTGSIPMNTTSTSHVDEQVYEANSCLALGAGLGAMGAGTALLAGATCPLCVVFAPALIGVGIWKRFSAWRTEASSGTPSKDISGSP